MAGYGPEVDRTLVMDDTTEMGGIRKDKVKLSLEDFIKKSEKEKKAIQESAKEVILEDPAHGFPWNEPGRRYIVPEPTQPPIHYESIFKLLGRKVIDGTHLLTQALRGSSENIRR